jgi:hypothetical protein
LLSRGVPGGSDTALRSGFAGENPELTGYLAAEFIGGLVELLDAAMLVGHDNGAVRGL